MRPNYCTDSEWNWCDTAMATNTPRKKTMYELNVGGGLIPPTLLRSKELFNFLRFSKSTVQLSIKMPLQTFILPFLLQVRQWVENQFKRLKLGIHFGPNKHRLLLITDYQNTFLSTQNSNSMAQNVKNKVKSSKVHGWPWFQGSVQRRPRGFGSDRVNRGQRNPTVHEWWGCRSRTCYRSGSGTWPLRWQSRRERRQLRHIRFDRRLSEKLFFWNMCAALAAKD